MFDKSEELFPYKKKLNFIAFCSVSPLYAPAAKAAKDYYDRQSVDGLCLYDYYAGALSIPARFRSAVAKLISTSPENITIPTNTSEALNLVANGYPFQPGDEIVSFVHEYPANHYPWVLQQKRGVKLKLLQNDNLKEKIPQGLVGGWSNIEALVTKKTKIISLSHVQFTSGYAADLAELGAFCKNRGIDLVIDAAQSLGSLPIDVEKYGISALAASGWKWLLGPVGTGVLYTSKAFRDKIEITMSGADHMLQQMEYLNHDWNPFEDGRKFNYSTISYASVEGLATVIDQVFNHYSVEAIQKEIFRLQDLALSLLDRTKYLPIEHEPRHRSGILAIVPKKGNAKEIHAELKKNNVLITPRDGYLRFAPHFCTTELEIEKAISLLNKL